MSRPNFHIPSAAPKKAPFADWLKPAGTCVGALLFLAGMNLLSKGMGGIPTPDPRQGFDVNYFWYVYFSGLKPHAEFITGAILLGGAAGIMGVGGVGGMTFLRRKSSGRRCITGLGAGWRC